MIIDVYCNNIPKIQVKYRDDLLNPHDCMQRFDTEKIDDCCGEGYNRCFGRKEMVLKVWYQDTNGLEESFDNWREIEVNFCPYCGLKSESHLKVNYDIT